MHRCLIARNRETQSQALPIMIRRVPRRRLASLRATGGVFLPNPKSESSTGMSGGGGGRGGGKGGAAAAMAVPSRPVGAKGVLPLLVG